MAFAYYKSTSFLLLSHIPSLLFHLMYINKRRFAENNREKVLKIGICQEYDVLKELDDKFTPLYKKGTSQSL